MFWILITAIVLLAIVSASLCFQNLVYRTKNRALIIQNDSLMGANIELSKLIHSQVAGSKDSLVTLSHHDNYSLDQ